MKFTVAIDGPAAAGKGTIAKAVAAHFGFAHLDTGLLYRAVGVLSQSGDPVQVARTLSPDDLQRDDLRSAAAAELASKVATNSEVRAALLAFQRAFSQRDGGAVLDGRDIGTVICPDADVKLFVIASDAIRAERRFKELLAKGEAVTYEGVLQDIKTRDARDAGRDVAPMIAAEDAYVLDTSKMSIDQAVAAAIAVINAKRTVG